MLCHQDLDDELALDTLSYQWLKILQFLNAYIYTDYSHASTSYNRK